MLLRMNFWVMLGIVCDNNFNWLKCNYVEIKMISVSMEALEREWRIIF